MSSQILWTFSEYLEAVAIIPQLVLLQRLKEVENLTSNYVFAIGACVEGDDRGPASCWMRSRTAH